MTKPRVSQLTQSELLVLKSRVRIDLSLDPTSIEALQFQHAVGNQDVTEREWDRFRSNAELFKEFEYSGSTFALEFEGANGMQVILSETGATAAGLARFVPGGRIRVMDDRFQTFADINGDPMAIDQCANVHPCERSRAAVLRYKKPKRFGIQHRPVNATSIPATKPVWNLRNMIDLTQVASVSGDMQTQAPINLLVQVDSLVIPPIINATGFTAAANSNYTLVLKQYHYFNAFGKQVLL